jgi:hypothetical protein
LSQKIAIWVLLLQEFTFEVQVKPGKSHVNTDYMSRLQGVTPEARIPDTFSDESLFHIEGHESLYFNIVQFLTHGIIPSNLSSEGKVVFVH